MLTSVVLNLNKLMVRFFMLLESWLALLLACSVMSLTPGTNAMLSLTTSITSGKSAGIRVVLGSLIGFTLLTVVAMTGLGTVLASAPSIINTLKYLGAVYLLYLAYGLAFKAKRQLNENNKGVKPNKLIQTGFILAISNPKVILFWLAFIPTIIKTQKVNAIFVVIVVATFVVIEGCIEMLMVLLGNRAKPFLQSYIHYIERVAACIFVIFSGLILMS